jgi:hypothetical protein
LFALPVINMQESWPVPTLNRAAAATPSSGKSSDTEEQTDGRLFDPGGHLRLVDGRIQRVDPVARQYPATTFIRGIEPAFAFRPSRSPIGWQGRVNV